MAAWLEWNSRGCRFGALGGLAALTVALAPGAHADVQYRETVRTYDISGLIETPDDIWKGIRRWGPSEMWRSGTVVGTARGLVRTKYQSRRNEAGRCSLTDMTVNVEVLIKLPTWDTIGSAPQHLQQYFACVRRTVTVHENRHAQIWYQTGARIAQASFAELDNVPCKDFSRRASEVYRRVFMEGRHRQAEFDRADAARRRYDRCDPRNGQVAASGPPNLWRPPRPSSRPSRPKFTPAPQPREEPDRRFAGPTPAPAPVDSGPPAGAPNGGVRPGLMAWAASHAVMLGGIIVLIGFTFVFVMRARAEKFSSVGGAGHGHDQARSDWMDRALAQTDERARASAARPHGGAMRDARPTRNANVRSSSRRPAGFGRR